MKKVILVSMSLISAAIFSASALASTEQTIDFLCPIGNSRGDLNNYGDVIIGYGQETVEGSNPTSIEFKYTIAKSDNIPATMTVYENSGASYDPTTGKIACSFESHEPEGYTPFTVTYSALNIKGGVIGYQDLKEIKVYYQVGLNHK